MDHARHQRPASNVSVSSQWLPSRQDGQPILRSPTRKHGFIGRDGGAKPRQRPRVARRDANRRECRRLRSCKDESSPRYAETRSSRGMRGGAIRNQLLAWYAVHSNRSPFRLFKPCDAVSAAEGCCKASIQARGSPAISSPSRGRARLVAPPRSSSWDACASARPLRCFRPRASQRRCADRDALGPKGSWARVESAPDPQGRPVITFGRKMCATHADESEMP